MSYDLLKQYQAIRKPKSQLWQESLQAGIDGLGDISGALMQRGSDANAKQRELERLREALGAELSQVQAESAALDNQMMGIENLDDTAKAYYEAERRTLDNRMAELQSKQAQLPDEANFRNVYRTDLPSIGKREVVQPRIGDIKQAESIQREKEAKQKANRGSGRLIVRTDHNRGVDMLFDPFTGAKVAEFEVGRAPKEYLGADGILRTTAKEAPTVQTVEAPEGEREKAAREREENIEDKEIALKESASEIQASKEAREQAEFEAEKAEKAANIKKREERRVRDFRLMRDWLTDAYNITKRGNVGGSFGEWKASYAGTEAAQVRMLIDDIVGKIALKELIDLKEAGGSMGALSDSEMKVLAGGMGTLSPEKANPDIALRNMAVFLNFLNRELEGEGNYQKLETSQYRPVESRSAAPQPSDSKALPKGSFDKLKKEAGQ